ncbi:MAG: thioredoxin domain-containing protein [Actinomycetes bacterium]
MSDKKKASKAKDTTNRNIAIGMVIFVVLVGVIFSVLSNKTNSKVSIPATVSATDGYGIVFNKDAKVKVDIWEDFQCPHCKDFESVAGDYINGLVRAGKIRAVYHPMTFIGPESVLAAAAAACTADSGKFLNMHAALYNNQAATENSGAWTNATLKLLAITAGDTSKATGSCIDSGKYTNWTNNVEADAAKKNVNSTPTMFINGKQLNQAHYLDLAALKADFAAAGVK